jgi:hypothetical protein
MMWLHAAEELMTMAVAQAQLGEMALAFYMREELNVFLEAFSRLGRRLPVSCTSFPSDIFFMSSADVYDRSTL